MKSSYDHIFSKKSIDLKNNQKQRRPEIKYKMVSMLILLLVNQVQIKARTAWFMDPYRNDTTLDMTSVLRQKNILGE